MPHHFDTTGVGAATLLLIPSWELVIHLHAACNFARVDKCAAVLTNVVKSQNSNMTYIWPHIGELNSTLSGNATAKSSHVQLII